MKSSLLECFWSIILGVSAGLVFFGGLWLTVQQSLKAKRYWLFAVSYFLRLGIVGSIFVFLLPKTWVAGAVFLLSMMAMKVILVGRDEGYAG